MSQERIDQLRAELAALMEIEGERRATELHQRRRRRVQERTREGAAQHNAQYTPEELVLLADKTISTSELAWVLGRSYYAIQAKRKRMGSDDTET